MIYPWVYNKVNVHILFGQWSIFCYLLNYPLYLVNYLKFTIFSLYPTCIYLQFTLSWGRGIVFKWVRKMYMTKYNTPQYSSYFETYVVMIDLFKLWRFTIEYIWFWHLIYPHYTYYLEKNSYYMLWNPY
jgi:hypothetical protein